MSGMYRILIVDDSSFMRKWLTKLIEDEKMKVVAEAKNGFEAILQYRRFQPDIVLLDIHLPELNGVDVLRRVLAINPKANVMICSAFSPDYLVNRCMQIGAKGFIKKPHFHQIKETVQKIVANQSEDGHMPRK